MRIILSGGGSDYQTKETYELYARIIDKNKPVLYIPIAMPECEFQNCMKWILEELKPYDILNIEQLTDIYSLESMDLDNYSSVFIGGGNTYSLLALLKDSMAIDKIKLYIKEDGIILGGSAGAIIMGYDINSCSYDDDNIVELKNTYGCDVFSGYSICCHYDDANNIAIESIRSFVKDGNRVIALPEETSLFMDGNTVTVIGSKPCTVFNGNVIEKFQPYSLLNVF